MSINRPLPDLLWLPMLLIGWIPALPVPAQTQGAYLGDGPTPVRRVSRRTARRVR